jgi:hypothetical protein
MTVRIEDGVPWIGNRSFPWAHEVKVTDLHPDERFPFRERRFKLMFENGWRLSIIFGNNAYCQNYANWTEDRSAFTDACPDAEIAAWCGDSDMLPWIDGDTVKGRVPAADLLRFIDSMMTWPNEFVPGSVLTLEGIVEGEHVG